MSNIWKPGILGLSVLVLASCDTGMTAGQSRFYQEYNVSRNALENGNYPKAVRSYARLVENAGPHAPRIRLEYAHSLLRANDFQSAANEARALSATQTGAARSAALAVQGTAEHELGLIAVDQGGLQGDGLQYLRSAQAAFGEVLKNNPELDPLGAVKSRKISVDAQLASLR